MLSSITLTALKGIPLIQPGDDLCLTILNSLLVNKITLNNGDILVIAQKIVSKAEGRSVSLDSISPSSHAVDLAKIVNKDPRLVELILQESKEVIRFKHDILIVEHRLGFIMANAGIDLSNVSQNMEGGDTALLLPLYPDATCASLVARLCDSLGVNVGVVINDSHGRAWRNGTVGVAIGAAGFNTLHDLRGKEDLFGRKLQTTEVGYADELASAASLLMGQANEGLPIVLIRGLDMLGGKSTAQDLIRPRENDLFR